MMLKWAFQALHTPSVGNKIKAYLSRPLVGCSDSKANGHKVYFHYLNASMGISLHINMIEGISATLYLTLYFISGSDM